MNNVEKREIANKYLQKIKIIDAGLRTMTNELMKEKANQQHYVSTYKVDKYDPKNYERAVKLLTQKSMELAEQKLEIVNQIMSLDNSLRVEFLLYHYVEGKTIAEIADLQHYSYSQSLRTKKKALNDFYENILDKREIR